MNQLTETFAFDSQAIRVVGTPEEPKFVASDVANALEYRDAHNATMNLDDDEKGTAKVSTPGGEQEMTVITEAGLYSLIFRSNKPEAKTFKRWVTHEVLPSIRKRGYYAAGAKMERLKKDKEELEERNRLLTSDNIVLMRQKLFGHDLVAFGRAQKLWRIWKGVGSYTEAAEIAGCSSSRISSKAKKYEHYLDATSYERMVLRGFDQDSLSPFEMQRAVKDEVPRFRNFLKLMAQDDAIVDQSIARLRKQNKEG